MLLPDERVRGYGEQRGEILGSKRAEFQEITAQHRLKLEGHGPSAYLRRRIGERRSRCRVLITATPSPPARAARRALGASHSRRSSCAPRRTGSPTSDARSPPGSSPPLY